MGYREFTEFKKKYDNSTEKQAIQSCENSHKLFSQTMDSRNVTKRSGFREIIRSKKILQRSGQNSIDMVRYVIPPMQYRGVPVFTELDSVNQKDLENKNKAFSGHVKKRSSSTNIDFGMSNNLALSPYKYTLKKKSISMNRTGMTNDENENVIMKDEHVKGTPLSRTSKNLNLNPIKVNNTKVNIKTDMSINLNSYRKH